MENATTKQMVYHILFRGGGAQDFQLTNSATTIMVGLSISLALKFLGILSVIMIIVTACRTPK